MTQMHIKWNRYEVFYHVARAGSVALAARQLKISPPSVSRMIKILEDELGVKLFYRGVKGLTITPEGMELLKRVSEAYEALNGGKEGVPILRDYGGYLKEWRRILGLDAQNERKVRGDEAAKVLVNSAFADTVLKLEKIRDEILEKKDE